MVSEAQETRIHSHFNPWRVSDLIAVDMIMMAEIVIDNVLVTA